MLEQNLRISVPVLHYLTCSSMRTSLYRGTMPISLSLGKSINEIGSTTFLAIP